MGKWAAVQRLLDRRLALYSEEQRMVLGANTFRLFLQVLGPSSEESEVSDPVNTRMRNLPTTVGAADFDLELIERRTLDGNIQELIYRPALHATVRPATARF